MRIALSISISNICGRWKANTPFVLRSVDTYKRIDELLKLGQSSIQLIAKEPVAMIVKISAIARTRKFGKAIRDMHKKLDGLAKSLTNLAIEDGIITAILVSVTDDIPDSEQELFPNDEGIFQVHVGCQTNPSLPSFAFDVLKRVSTAILCCNLSLVDNERMKAVMDQAIHRHENEV
jgi:hypothetical protein